MALYEFKCDECEAQTEVLRPVDRRDECPPCPNCGAGTRRRFSALLINPVGWGLAMVPHGAGRRVSKAQADEHTHWQRTRYGDQAPAPLDADYKPKHFTP